VARERVPIGEAKTELCIVARRECEVLEKRAEELDGIARRGTRDALCRHPNRALPKIDKVSVNTLADASNRVLKKKKKKPPFRDGIEKPSLVSC
jgi:sugar-specific transcriptional regulator TrmB